MSQSHRPRIAKKGLAVLTEILILADFVLPEQIAQEVQALPGVMASALSFGDPGTRSRADTVLNAVTRARLKIGMHHAALQEDARLEEEACRRRAKNLTLTLTLTLPLPLPLPLTLTLTLIGGELRVVRPGIVSGIKSLGNSIVQSQA